MAAVKRLALFSAAARVEVSANRTLRGVIVRIDSGRRRKTVMLDPVDARLLAAELKTAADDAERGQR